MRRPIHAFIASLLGIVGQGIMDKHEGNRPLLSHGCHRPNHSRIGGTVKANQRAARKARNVRRNRRAHR